MKKYITIIAAGLALVFTGLFAQETPTLDERITNAWHDRQTEGFYASAEIDTLVQDVLAADPSTVSQDQALIIMMTGSVLDEDPNRQVTPANLPTGADQWLRNQAETNPPISDIVAVWLDSDPSQLRDDYNPNIVVSWGLRRGDLTFDDVAEYVVGSGYVNTWYKKKFKSYRSTLPKAEQIAMTQKEKDGLIAVPSRSAAQDKWLTEVSADLMALSLDQ